MQIVTWVVGVFKGLVPATTPLSSTQPNAVLALNSAGAVAPQFISYDGGNSSSVYELPNGSTLNGGHS